MTKSSLANYNSANGNGGINLVSFETPITNFFPLKPLPHLVSDFTINAPNVKIDPLADEIVKQISKVLYQKTTWQKPPTKGVEWEISSILDSESKNGKSLKSFLVKNGKSAVISEVSKKLNKSNLDHTTKYILSKEPFYVYALGYAIYYEEVEDVGGLYNRVLSVYKKEIKPCLDEKAMEAFINQKHLNLSPAKTEKIFQEVRKSTISYLKGEPVKIFNNAIINFVNYGNLNFLVDEFFEKGNIQKERGTPYIKKLMVQYLTEIGLIVSDNDVESTLDSEIEMSSPDATVAKKENDTKSKK